MPAGNRPTEIIMTVLHAGGKFDSNNYKVSGPDFTALGYLLLMLFQNNLNSPFIAPEAMHRQTYSRVILPAIWKSLVIMRRRGPSLSFFQIEIFTAKILKTRPSEENGIPKQRRMRSL